MECEKGSTQVVDPSIIVYFRFALRLLLNKRSHLLNSSYLYVPKNIIQQFCYNSRGLFQSKLLLSSY